MYYIVSVDDDRILVFESEVIPDDDCEVFSSWEEAWDYAQSIETDGVYNNE